MPYNTRILGISLITELFLGVTINNFIACYGLHLKLLVYDVAIYHLLYLCQSFLCQSLISWHPLAIALQPSLLICGHLFPRLPQSVDTNFLYIECGYMHNICGIK